MMQFSPFFLLLAGLPTVVAWGAAGHEVVATIAQIHLHPTVFPVLCDILNFTSTNPNEPLCHLAPVATWADRLKYRMRWSAPLHYVGGIGDHPSQTCKFPGERGWEGARMNNVLGGIRNTTNILEEYMDDGNSITTANEALKFLIHFVGDMHMPLHLTGRDRGGNSNKVRFGGRVTNLHSVWDGLLIAKAIRETPQNYSRPLPSPQIEFSLRGTIYDSYVRRIMWEGILSQWASELPSWVSCPDLSMKGGSLWQTVLSAFTTFNPGETDDATLCPYHWAQPIHALNCDLVWPRELDEPPYNGGTHLEGEEQYMTGDHHAECDDHAEDLRGDDYKPRDAPLLQLDTPQYAGVIKDDLVIEKLLAQAGIRLAAVLNWLFADDGDKSLDASIGLRVPEVAF